MFIIDFSDFTDGKFVEGLKWETSLSSYLSGHTHDGGYAIKIMVNNTYIADDPFHFRNGYLAYIIHSTLKSFNNALSVLSSGNNEAIVEVDLGCNAKIKLLIKKSAGNFLFSTIPTGDKMVDWDNHITDEPVDQVQVIHEITRSVALYKETIKQGLYKVAPNEIDKWMNNLFSDWLSVKGFPDFTD